METLNEAAIRLCSNRCGNECDGCPANNTRLDSGTGVCLIRRIARTPNAAEQIDFLIRWMETNPPMPEERKGHWVRPEPVSSDHPPLPIFICDQCNRVELVPTRYCASCGARMER